ncbi:transposase [Bacillus cereus]|uniref:transposase n=1 Tax=Bacillus cereus TaxID=1396 RepID=UPI00356E5403
MTPLSNRFTRIRILDSTAFQLPAQYASSYKGLGGGASEARVIIQLEYELVSGEFLDRVVTDGTSSDRRYGQERTQTLEPGELSLRNLGYFSIYDLKEIASRKAFYVSRIRWNTQVYKKERDERLTLLNLEELTKELSEGQTLELPEVYIELHKKHKTRLVIYRLTQAEWAERLEHHKKAKKKIPKYASRINLLITNVSSKQFLHNEVKPVKLERFQCHLHGQLIGLCLVASITFELLTT